LYVSGRVIHKKITSGFTYLQRLKHMAAAGPSAWWPRFPRPGHVCLQALLPPPGNLR
jgi:hypothetical protein